MKARGVLGFEQMTPGSHPDSGIQAPYKTVTRKRKVKGVRVVSAPRLHHLILDLQS